MAQVAGSIGAQGLSNILIKMGCSSSLAFFLGLAFRAFFTTGVIEGNMMTQSNGEIFPSHSGSGGPSHSHSWKEDSFEIDVLLDETKTEGTSARSSVARDEESQMDESNCNGKEPEMSIKNTKRLDHWYNVEYRVSPSVVKRDIAQKLYQFLSFFNSSITQELDKCKKDEIRINNDIKWFASGDKGGKWKKQNSEHVEEALLGKEEELELQMRPIPRTDAGLINYTTDTHWIRGADGYRRIADVCTDKKRCHNRLNKGRMDLGYLQQVQDELLSQEKTTYFEDATQELDYVMESLVHRIQHGNNNRADEGKLYQEIRRVNNTMEIYTAPTEPDDDIWGPSSTRPALDKQQRQHQSKIVLNQLKEARTIRRGQLNLELDLLRQKIRCIERLLEKISLKMKAAYKCAYELAEQQNEESSYSECKSHMTYVKEQAEYKLLMTYVKELARRGDIVELMQVCDRQLFEGCSKF